MEGFPNKATPPLCCWRESYLNFVPKIGTRYGVKVSTLMAYTDFYEHYNSEHQMEFHIYDKCKFSVCKFEMLKEGQDMCS